MSLTLAIIIMTVLLSYQAFNNANMFEQLKHHPYVEKRTGQWYRFLSAGFIHADWLHLIVNMYVLWSFGGVVEGVFTQHFFGPLWGRVLFLALYLLSIVVASLPSYVRHQDNAYYAAIGASGAVSAIVFTYILFSPWAMLYIYGILPIPAVLAGVLYLVYSWWADKRGRDNIGHDAHFWGAVFGFGFTIALKPSLLPNFLAQLVNEMPF